MAFGKTIFAAQQLILPLAEMCSSRSLIQRVSSAIFRLTISGKSGQSLTTRAKSLSDAMFVQTSPGASSKPALGKDLEKLSRGIIIRVT